MLDLVKFILQSIVDDPEQVQLETSVDETGQEVITATVAPEDMGRVIGKSGRIISAIREIIKVKAIRSGKRVRLILKDPLETSPASPSEPQAEPLEIPEN